jgi:hypothetical protein
MGSKFIFKNQLRSYIIFVKSINKSW